MGQFSRHCLVLVAVVVAVAGCAGFSGRVVTPAGKPVAGARVDVALYTDTTDAEGRFAVGIAETRRLVMTIAKDGYAPVSRVYGGRLQGGEWTMVRATRRLVDPSRPMAVEDPGGGTDCPASLGDRVDWARFPGQRVQRFDQGDGRMTTGRYPPALQRAVERIAAGVPCAAGMSVSIPPDGLVDGSARPPRGEVAVSVAAIDRFAPDGMPGDFTVADAGTATAAEPRYFEPLAAGSVTVTADGRSYQLHPVAEATLILAVDVDRPVGAAARLPETLPLLAYDFRRGAWHVAGTAALDQAGRAYGARIARLGVYAVGRIRTAPACVAFDSGTIDGNFDLEVTIPIADSLADSVAVRTSTFANQKWRDPVHVLANLPADTDIELRGYKGVGRTRCPVTAGLGVNTGPSRPADTCRQRPAVKLVEVSPGPPALSAEVSSDGSVALNWGFHWCSIYTVAGFDGYRLQESRTSPEKGFYEIRQFPGGTGAATEYSVVGNPPGTFWYRIGAFRGGRLTEHGWSDPVGVRIGGLHQLR